MYFVTVVLHLKRTTHYEVGESKNINSHSHVHRLQANELPLGQLAIYIYTSYTKKKKKSSVEPERTQ